MKMFEFVSVEERKFTLKQTAELLGVDQSTVSRLLSGNKLGHFKINSKKLVSESHLTDYLKSIERLAKKTN